MSRDGVRVALGPGKQRALLTGLLLDTGRPLATDRLVTLLWDERPPSSAMANIRTYAARLRTALADPGRPSGSRLERRSPGYVVFTDPAELDARVFTALVAEGRQALADGRWETAEDRLGRALALWSGTAAAEDVVRGDALAARLAVFDELRLTAIEDLAAARLALGRYAALVPELRALLADHPLRERLWGHLVSALYQAGDVQGALDAYAAAGQMLRAELGVEPGEELVRLHRAVRARDSLGPVQPLVAHKPHELPPDCVDLVGRARESHLIDRQLAGRRRPAVVVVHGPAGAGKSALAIHAAHRNAGRFPDGQLYATLFDRAAGRPVPPGVVVARFLRALGDPAVDAPIDEAAARLRTVLAGRRVLMVLSDCVSEAQVRPLLPTTAGSAALIVSWWPLGALDGVTRVEVGPLARRDAARMLGPLGHAGLVELSGGLPLALRIMAGRLATAEWVYGDLSLRASLQANYQALHPTAARLLCLLGMVRTMTVDAGMAAALLDGDPTAAFEQLVHAHLVVRLRRDRWRVADLVQGWAGEIAMADLSAVQREAALHRLVAYLVELAGPSPAC